MVGKCSIEGRFTASEKGKLPSKARSARFDAFLEKVAAIPATTPAGERGADGMITATEEPGFDVALDMAKIKKYAI